MVSGWWHRWRDRAAHDTSGASSGLGSAVASRAPRTEVCPPALKRTGQGVRDWLVSGGFGHPSTGSATAALASRSSEQLLSARRDFVQALDDVASPLGQALQHRIQLARSLRELWHLRSEVFNLVSLERSQFDAQQRLDHLNHHFETRAQQRSAFGLLSEARSRISSW